MIYRCRVCNQPILRDAAVKTLAGGYNGGYCQRHAPETPDVSSTILNSKKGGEDGQSAQDAPQP